MNKQPKRRRDWFSLFDLIIKRYFKCGHSIFTIAYLYYEDCYGDPIVKVKRDRFYHFCDKHHNWNAVIQELDFLQMYFDIIKEYKKHNTNIVKIMSKFISFLKDTSIKDNIHLDIYKRDHAYCNKLFLEKDNILELKKQRCYRKKIIYYEYMY